MAEQLYRYLQDILVALMMIITKVIDTIMVIIMILIFPVLYLHGVRLGRQTRMYRPRFSVLRPQKPKHLLIRFHQQSFPSLFPL